MSIGGIDFSVRCPSQTGGTLYGPSLVGGMSESAPNISIPDTSSFGGKLNSSASPRVISHVEALQQAAVIEDDALRVMLRGDYGRELDLLAERSDVLNQAGVPPSPGWSLRRGV